MKLRKEVLITAGVFTVAAGIISAAVYYVKKMSDKIMAFDNRYKDYYKLSFEWLAKKNDGNSAIQYFKNNGINTIAIYGMGTMGEVLYGELKDSEIKIAYFIDKNAEDFYTKFGDTPVVVPEDIENQEKVDAIIITPFYDYEVICDSLESIGSKHEFISLEEVIYGM